MNYFTLLLLFLAACTRPPQTPNDPTVWKKIKIDFNKLDNDGLSGPPDGKVAVNYEFCIPAEERYWLEVKKIDATAEKHARSAGRSNCGKTTWLVIGSTHQKNHRRVLYDLAALPYIQKIEPTFWE